MFFLQSAAGFGQLLPTPDINVISDVFIHFIYGGTFSISREMYIFIFIPPLILCYLGSFKRESNVEKKDYFLPVLLFLIPLYNNPLNINIQSQKNFLGKHFFYCLPFLYIVLARGIAYLLEG